MEVILSPDYSIKTGYLQIFIKHLQTSLNEAFKNKNYGGHLERIYIGPMLLEPRFLAVLKVRKPKFHKHMILDEHGERTIVANKIELEYEYVVDVNQLAEQPNEKAQRAFIIDEIKRNLDRLMEKDITTKIGDFDMSGFISDLRDELNIIKSKL